MMKVKVLLFAQARQIVGQESAEVTVESGCTVADLKQSLAAAYPDLESLLSRSSIALDQQYAVDSDIVNSDVEAAMIPPVSGG